MEKAKILVIDDDPVSISVLLSILGDQYEVTSANAGSVALELLSVLRPHLILLDITMPDVNGYQVLSALKSDAATASIPILVISSLTEPSDREFALKLGADDYLTKPIAPSTVFEMTCKYLGS
ncbi:response regulator [Shewanella sp. JM162201]|uniref:Response regulator n=1 Tax=Shewanella jiangmenensis TaxID=2837387 RepID=A0ABS5V7F6_9GAMM|nr:response regulator [Shewanella jiangmenensis]MBT1446369.1 response regulator [Shewanella jiangmenensis]